MSNPPDRRHQDSRDTNNGLSKSHCDTCKVLSGGTFTCNQIIPRSDIKITKGKLNDYTYYGDSGNSPCLLFPYPLIHHFATVASLFTPPHPSWNCVH